MKYQFIEPRRMDKLSNGRIRCYYGEEIGTESITTRQESGEEVTEEHPVYAYKAVDVDAPVDKAKVVDALVRTRYSQSDVEAIIRHSLAQAEGSAEEFAEFNAFAEECKREAARILADE